MRTKRIILGCLAFLALLLSCERETKVSTSLSEDDFLLKCQDLRDYIKKNAETIDYDALINFARQYDDFESYEVTDSILYIHFKDEYTYFFDMFGVSAPDTTGLSFFDTSIVTHLLDSLTSLTSNDLGFDDTSAAAFSTNRILTKAGGDTQLVRLRRRNMLFWHNIDFDSETILKLNDICHKCNISLKVSSDIDELAKLGGYDIVLFQSHGCPNGVLGFSMDYKDQLKKRGINIKIVGSAPVHRDMNGKWLKDPEGNDLEEDLIGLWLYDIKKLFPQDLSSTIMWTSVCYGGDNNSLLKMAAFDANVAEYYGCTYTTNISNVLTLFSKFAPLFFNYCFDSQSAFGHEDGVGMGGLGRYRRFGNKTVFYVGSGALDPIQDNNKWFISAYRVIAPSVLRLLGYYNVNKSSTRSGGMSTDGSGEGLRLINENSGEEKYIPFSNQTVRYIKAFDHDGFVRFNIAVDPGELDSESTYKYASYFTDENGNKVTEGEYVYFTPEMDLRELLIKFYYDTDGPNWVHNDNWCSDKPLEEWYGIVPDVYDHDCVQICLDSNGLSGEGSLAGCELITYLNVYDNQLTSLNVSGCSAIGLMYCIDNQLTSLDVSRCTSMTTLDCYGNQLESLNVSGCSSLIGLYCGKNKLTHLDISECSSLLTLHCGDNLFTSLDFSEHPTLQKLECYGSYSLTSLNVSGCSSLVELECGTDNGWGGGSKHIPLTSLDVTNCSNLTSLTINEGSLTSLNLSGCYALKTLWCSDNYLQSVDISDCKSLNRINFTRNQLSNISLSGYTDLITVYLGNNYLTNLSLRGCKSLENLDCRNNSLRSLDLSGCISLTGLSCEHNRLSSLDLSDSSNIEDVFADNNNLVSINLRNRKHLKYLWCNYNNLTDLDVSECPQLESFQISGNRQLKSLAMNGCSSIKSLDCSSLSLQNLGIMNCSSLETLRCENNQLTSLNTEGCGSLRNLSCQNNSITQQIPQLFKQLDTFVHDQKYLYYYDENGNLTYSVNEAGWYYPGEPGKGYHGW